MKILHLTQNIIKNTFRIPYIFSHKAARLSDAKKLIDKILKKKTKIKKNKDIEKYIYNFNSKYTYLKVINEIKKLSNNTKSSMSNLSLK